MLIHTNADELLLYHDATEVPMPAHGWSNGNSLQSPPEGALQSQSGWPTAVGQPDCVLSL